MSIMEDTIKDDDDSSSVKTSSFNFIPEGFQLKSLYIHSKKLTDLVDVTYNPRSREFIFLDTRGITTWNKDSIHNKVSRGLNYPKYQNKLLVKIIYARKFNVYFCIAKDFSLKVLNMNFEETCNVDSDLSSVMFLIFNPVRDELITGGVKGTMVWEFRQDTDRVWKEIKPMANYALFLQRELKCVGGSWVKKVELDQHQQYLYCCSDTDVICYDIYGKMVFKLPNAHQSQITGCKYCPQARLLITCSADTNVKVWSMTGGHVHTFRGHSKAVTNILLHPESPSLVLTSSMDGSVRLWSLEIMDMIYSITVSVEGIQWMGLTGENYLWTATKRDLSVWHLNHVVELYTLTRSKITSIKVLHCRGKTSRIVAVGDDSSMRLVSIKHRKNLSTVLPPANISPMEKILGIAYNREHSLAYLLVTPHELWVYTMRTDPACRIGIWDIGRVQDKIDRCHSTNTDTSPHPGQYRCSSRMKSAQPAHQENQPSTATVECSSITVLNIPIMYKGEEGYVCPLKTNFLVLGMVDGRVLFMDPIKFGEIYFQHKAYKDAILEITVENVHRVLITKCKCRAGGLFRFWDLPSLELKYEVDTDDDTTCYALLDNVFLTGHATGHLVLYKLTEIQQTATYGGIDVHTQSQQSELVQSKIEHKGGVVAIDSCCQLKMFVSCGEDNVIKICNKHKVTITEVILDGPISSAYFLNVKGDLLIGYKNHLFLISHTKLISQDCTSLPDSCIESESDIYEDPAVRFEGVASNTDPINMARYLVPYNLDFSIAFLEGESSESEQNSVEESEEDSDSDMSMAPSDIYLSPSGTPRTLSVIDMILNSEFNQQDINSEILKLKKRSILKMMKEQESEMGDYEMPKFGVSPGPSPTITPSSTPEYNSSSEIEEEEDKNEEIISEPLSTTEHPLDVMSLIDVQPPKPLPVETPPDEPVPQQLSRYSLANVKIDVKSLMKQSINQTSKKKAVSHQKSDRETKINEKPSSASKRIIQKKKQKGTRTLAKNKTRSKQTVSDDLQHSKSTNPNMITKIDTNTKTDVIEAEQSIDDSDVNLQVSSYVTEPVSEAGLALESQTTPEAEGARDELVSDSSGEEESDATTDVRKLKPSSASGTEGKESDVISVISIPNGRLKVGNPSSTKSKDILSYGEKMEKGKKSKMTEKQINQEDPTEKRGLKQKRKFNDKGKSKDKLLKDERLEGKHKQEADTKKSKDTGSMSFLKAASRLSITEKYSLHKASRKSISKEESRPSSASVTTSTEYHTSSAISNRATTAVYKPSCIDPEDPNLDEEEYLLEDFIDEKKNTSRRLKESLMRLQQQSTDEQSYFEEESGVRGRSKESLIHPLFSEMNMCLKSTVDDGTIARPNTAEYGNRRRYPLERPHTVATGDLYALQDDMSFDSHYLQRNISLPGSPVDLLKNDGTRFDDNWQDRMIERNQLLSLKKAERARFAFEKRQIMEERLRQRRKSLLGHHNCSGDISEQEAHLIHRQKALKGHRSGSTDIPDQTNTYCLTCSESSLDLLKKHQSPAMKTRPGTPPQPKHYKETNDLSQEMAYRFRLNKDPKILRSSNKEMFEKADGTSGPMLVRRPHTPQSIPNKAKFVLLKPFHPTARLTPSPLEEHLLMERFPEMRRRIIRHDELERNIPTPNVLVSYL